MSTVTGGALREATMVVSMTTRMQELRPLDIKFQINEIWRWLAPQILLQNHPDNSVALDYSPPTPLLRIYDESDAGH